MKRLTVLFLLTVFTCLAGAQVKSVKIGVNGLTCSQCSRTVEMSIRKLPFVTDVKMNLEHTEGEIFVDNSKEIDMQKIAKAVTNAGFSVRYLDGVYEFHGEKIDPGSCVNISGKQFVFVKSQSQTLKGKVTLEFLGAAYQPKKDFKQWQPLLTTKCNEPVYYVTLKNS